jgi:hypothetical protein
MRTKRAVARSLMQELKAAYVDLDSTPYEDDPDRSAQAIGRYDGLKRAYILLTGRSALDVSNEVVTWYVGTPEYQAAKEHYERPAS